VRARSAGSGIIYSINILSDLTWNKTEPPAMIKMTLIDDGGMQLMALDSSFVVCAF
jgi:hypothetical protein